jgi:hypothetical protein
MDPDLSDFMIADVVTPTAGRETGKLYYVVGQEGEYIFLANGKDRSLEKPKRKKRKHASKVLRSETRVAEKLRSGDKVLNSELRRDLAYLSQNVQSKAIGG